MKRTILTVILMLSALLCRAQEMLEEASDNDLRARTGFGVSVNLARRLSMEWEEELRMKSNIGELDRIYSTVALAWKVNDHLKIAPEYSLVNLRDTHNSGESDQYTDWDMRHRVALNVTGSVKAGQWKFSLRERPQLMIRTDSLNSMEKVANQFALRSRVMAEYSLRRYPLKPYVFVEVTNTLNTPDRYEGVATVGGVDLENQSYKLNNYISKIRYSAGVKYRFNSHSSIDFYYRLDTGKSYDIHIDVTKKDGSLKKNPVLERVTKEPYNHHIIGLFYNYAF